MKAPDIVESWKWQHGEKIIERLLGLSDRTIHVPVAQHVSQPKDKYYTLARRQRIREAMKR